MRRENLSARPSANAIVVWPHARLPLATILRKLHDLALIVREADIRGTASVSPEPPGFTAILDGFFLLNMPDSDTLKLELPILDGLYRFCQGKGISE